MHLPTDRREKIDEIALRIPRAALTRAAASLSAHYRDGHAVWEQGAPAPFLPGAARHRLRLIPGTTAHTTNRAPAR